jgi:hypothetical protein
VPIPTGHAADCTSLLQGVASVSRARCHLELIEVRPVRAGYKVAVADLHLWELPGLAGLTQS